jgi:hypothetical protein
MRRSCPRLRWQLLAGIGKVESDHGRSPAPGVRRGVNRHGCCAGPMQFNLTNGPPSTWDTFKRPGDSVYDPADAIPAAARKLCANGLTDPATSGTDPCPSVRGTPAEHRAVKRYNNACWYVHQVLVLADRYTREEPQDATARDPFVRALTSNPHIQTTASHGCDPAPDLASGRLDLRVQALLAALAERHSIRISCLPTGHSTYVKGTRRVSNHTVWRAVDLDQSTGSRSARRARRRGGWWSGWTGFGQAAVAGVHPDVDGGVLAKQVLDPLGLDRGLVVHPARPHRARPQRAALAVADRGGLDRVLLALARHERAPPRPLGTRPADLRRSAVHAQLDPVRGGVGDPIRQGPQPHAGLPGDREPARGQQRPHLPHRAGGAAADQRGVA